MTQAQNVAELSSDINSSGQLSLTAGVTGILPVANGGTGTSTGPAAGGSTSQVQFNSAGAFAGSANFVFDGTNVGIGTASPVNKLDIYSASAIASRLFSDSTPTQIVSRASTDTGAPQIQLYKYRGTQASPTIVASGDSTGRLQFFGYDGAALRATAEIRSEVDGTPGSSDMPGRLLFYTTADGAASITERMRIDSSGNVLIGTTTSAAPLTVIKSVADNLVYLQNTNTTAGTSYGLALSGGTNGSDYALKILNAAASSELMRVTGAGDVGIGTSSPSGKLDVYTGGNTDAYIRGGGAVRLFISASSYDWKIASNYYATGGLQFVNTGTIIGGFDQNGNFAFNSGYGSAATAYGCRAWVNFAGSTGTIRASGNVSSITRSGTGVFTVNFTNAMPDVNYSVSGSTGGAGSNGYMRLAESTSGTMNTGSVVINTMNNVGNNVVDQPYTLVAVFR